jgi:hypothetical protein
VRPPGKESNNARQLPGRRPDTRRLTHSGSTPEVSPDALAELPSGYLLPPGMTMADVLAVDRELLAQEGIDVP